MKKRIFAGLVLFLVSLNLFGQGPQTTPQRAVYEGVIGDRGKTLGTTILFEISGNAVTGWLRHQNFQRIENGSGSDSSITFTSSGNTYKIDTRNSRISYSGPDGSGDQRVVKMEPVRGWVYKLTEESDYGRYMTLRLPEGDREFLVERPSVWKREGPPIEEFSEYSQLEQLLGKTITLWRVRVGGTYSVEVIEEPEGVKLLGKLPKKKKGKEHKP